MRAQLGAWTDLMPEDQWFYCMPYVEAPDGLDATKPMVVMHAQLRGRTDLMP